MATRKRKLSAYEQEQLKRQQQEWAAKNAYTEQQMQQARDTYAAQNAQTEAERAQLQAEYNRANALEEAQQAQLRTGYNDTNALADTQAKQYIADALKSYDTGKTNLFDSSRRAATGLGIGRSSYAGQYAQSSAERQALDTTKSQAEQDYANRLESLKQQRAEQENYLANRLQQYQATRQGQTDTLADQLASYNLAKQNQANELAGMQSQYDITKQNQANQLYGMMYENYTPAKPKPKQPVYNNTYTARISGLGSALKAGMPQTEYDRIYKDLKYQSDAYEKQYQNDYMKWYYSTH